MEKTEITTIAASYGLTACSVRIDGQHLYFLKRDGELLNDEAWTGSEVMGFVTGMVPKDEKWEEKARNMKC